MIHQKSDVQTESVGKNTNIWQYCVVLPHAKIGSGCNICSHVFIENDVIVGDNVTIKNGVQLWNGIRISDGVFIGPNVTFTNDLYPRSKQYPQRFLETEIGTGATIGANATILPGIKVGERAMIGAGAVITKNVPPNAIVTGNPGVITGYVGADKRSTSTEKKQTHCNINKNDDLDVGGCALVRLPLIPDIRGTLSVAEYEKQIPFVPKRCFWVFDVPSREVRGEHAHKTLHQYLICLKGSVNVLIDDGKTRKDVVLDEPNLGLHIPPLVWGVQYKYSQDALLLVLASDAYDDNDYFRDYDEFISYVTETRMQH